MGSGPATHLASLNNAYSLLLMSPYTSIKDVARSLFGRMSFLVAPLVYERFRNIDAIKNARCPVFFLHGMKDKLIPHSHSLDLNNHCPSISFLQLPPDMDHNQFDFEEDLVKPFKEFLRKIDEGIASEKRRSSLNPLKQVAKQEVTLVRIDDSVVVFRDGSQKKRPNDEGEDNEGSDENHLSSSEDDEVEDTLVHSGDKFEIVFDKSLFEPPQTIKIIYNKLEAVAKS